MLGLVLAAAVAAAPPSPPAVPPHARDPEGHVCRTEPIQGSRILHQVCLTPAEAAQLRRDGRTLLEHAQAGSQAPNMATLVQMTPTR